LIELTVCIVNGVASACGCKKQKPLEYSCSGGQCAYDVGSSNTMATHPMKTTDEENQAMKVATKCEWQNGSGK